MFLQESSNEEGVTVVVSAANLAGGWDIINVSVQGRDLPPTRRGEFATAQEAEKAAFARGAEFLKQNPTQSKF
ncbi:hypothetical protein LZ023_26800 [Pseudomonas silvicola]|nr:hypothetical protein LZ023_26800 [Pseudomonas silvicola]